MKQMISNHRAIESLEDFIYYENSKDMLDKIAYYLTHEDERIAIARNGFERTAANHTYKHRIEEMLSYF